MERLKQGINLPNLPKTSLSRIFRNQESEILVTQANNETANDDYSDLRELLEVANQKLGIGELLVSNSEKDKQIRLYQKQLSVVKRALALTKKKLAAAAAQSVSSEAPKRKNSTEDSSGGGAAVLQQNPTLKALLSQDTSITRRYGH